MTCEIKGPGGVVHELGEGQILRAVLAIEPSSLFALGHGLTHKRDVVIRGAQSGYKVSTIYGEARTAEIGVGDSIQLVDGLLAVGAVEQTSYPHPHS